MGEWEQMSDRIAFWADMDHPYVTYENDYIESEWWSLKQIYEKGLLYKGHKVVPYCPRCGTALSSHEAQQLFNLQFNGQAMGIPACFAQNIISAHALIPRHQILKAARDQMADMRHSVGSRRAIKKAKRRLVRLRRHGFFGNVVLLPKIQYLQFPGAKVHPGFYFLIHVFGVPLSL